MDLPTKTRLVWGGFFVCVGLAVWLLWKSQKVIDFGKRHPSSEKTLAFLEYFLAILSTAIAASNKVWEFPFATRPLWTSIVLTATIFTGFLACYAKWLRDRVKEKDKEIVADLTMRLQTAQTLLDRHRRLTNQISGLVDRKIKRVRETVKKAATAIDDLTVLDARELQVHTILRSIYDFFLFDLRATRPAGQMRIYLYLPEEEPEPHMQIFYKWNGTNSDCVVPPENAMKLMSPEGIGSEIVRTYHLPGSAVLSLVPNCVTPDFRKLYQNQDEYLKSMLSFKYKYQKNGTDAAMVLSLDCDEPNFFSDDRYREISEFLVEMLKRFEYEMLGLEIIAKLQPPPAP